MPLLRRDDGVNFVLQPYRETLTIKNTSLLRKEIHYLAQAHGDNVRLFKRPSGEFEAVFSQESGYLFGESIWQHFGQPNDLIYCEVLSREDNQALLVIVHDGAVYLDAKLSIEQIADEVSGLLAANTGRYEVHTYGQLPIDFTVPAVKARHSLESSVYAELTQNDKLHLLSVENALDEYYIGTKKRSSLIAITIVCLVALGGLWWYAQQRSQPTVVQVNPYEQYELALQTPDPGQQIDSLVKNLAQVATIEGWYPDSFNYNGQVAQVPMRSLGGTATGLMTSAQKMNMSVNFSSGGAALSFATVLSGRPTPDRIASTQQVIGIIIDRMMQILPGKSVQVNNNKDNQVFTQSDITISFNDVSPETLQLIGTNLNDLPVSLSNCTANIKSGLFSGSLQLAVVGK